MSKAYLKLNKCFRIGIKDVLYSFESDYLGEEKNMLSLANNFLGCMMNV